VAVAVRAHAEETNLQNHERRAQAETDRRALEKSSAASRASWQRSRMACISRP
jgi:surface antigen